MQRNKYDRRIRKQFQQQGSQQHRSFHSRAWVPVVPVINKLVSTWMYSNFWFINHFTNWFSTLKKSVGQADSHVPSWKDALWWYPKIGGVLLTPILTISDKMKSGISLIYYKEVRICVLFEAYGFQNWFWLFFNDFYNLKNINKPTNNSQRAVESSICYCRNPKLYKYTGRFCTNRGLNV